MPFTLLLFDIDGTLIRTGGAGRKAMMAAFEQVLGIPKALEGLHLGGRTDLSILRYVLDTHVGNSEGLEEKSTSLFASYLRHLPRTLEETQGYEILPGVVDILDWLSERSVPMGIATGNIREGASLKLGRGDLWRYFSLGGFGDDAEVRSNILRAGWKRAINQFGGPETPEEVLVIGDTTRDITAAREAGMKVAAVATGSVSYQDLAAEKPDYLWESMFEGLSWMQNGGLS